LTFPEVLSILVFKKCAIYLLIHIAKKILILNIFFIEPTDANDNYYE